jgi:hypothetical protein
MKRDPKRLAVVALGVFFAVSPVCGATLLHTNAPCVYLLTSNHVSRLATLIGTTGFVSGEINVPAAVHGGLFTVTAIAPGAFKDCTGIDAFSLDTASEVTTIGEGAFWGCTNLTTVTLREAVSSIQASAFLRCSALTNINLAAATGLTALAAQTFSGCSRLSSLSMPDTLKTVGNSAFRNCIALTALAIPSRVSSIENSAFQGCTRLASVTFPGVTRCGINVFAGSGLASVVIPSGLTNISQGAFADCTNLVSVTYVGLPETLGSAAFKNCIKLTRLPVSASLSAIASTAFDGCEGLTAVSIPSGVRVLSDNLFENCTSLGSVAFSESVTNMGAYAFANCPALTNVTALGDAPAAEETAFSASEAILVYFYAGTSGWKNLLALRPTVMLRTDGLAEAVSFAAWAVENGLVAASGLSAEALAALFDAASPTVSGLANGAVFVFGGNLTAADQRTLLRITIEERTPIVETPAQDAGSEPFASVTLEGTTDLTSGVWDLAVNKISLADVTRSGYTPAPVNGVLPFGAFFRMTLTLNP